MDRCEIGLVGLGGIGQNLALNLERRGYRVGVFELVAEKQHHFVGTRARGRDILPAGSLQYLASVLEVPRWVVLVVPAESVDEAISRLRPHLRTGDLILDCGNSHFRDTERRQVDLKRDGISLIGMGLSGGLEGALEGPCLMPGGDPEMYRQVEGLFRDVAAQVDGEPCVAYIGPGGAGHYVKMVHNGIEYAEMQFIAEAYAVLRGGFGFSPEELQQVFQDYNQGCLASYLIEITAEIFSRQDEETGRPLVDLIRDHSIQKGTGRWVVQEALDLGYPVPILSSAVSARLLSTCESGRQQMPGAYSSPQDICGIDRVEFILGLEDALYAARVCAYAEGFGLLAAASQQYGYGLNLETIARIWRGGCILRSRLLSEVAVAFSQDGLTSNLLLSPLFKAELLKRQQNWRRVIQTAAGVGVPTPALSAALAAFDSYRSPRLPANLIQAQRDYFGAHTYQRIDREGDFHTHWKAEPEEEPGGVI